MDRKLQNTQFVLCNLYCFILTYLYSAFLDTYLFSRFCRMKQVCVLVGCVPPACWPLAVSISKGGSALGVCIKGICIQGGLHPGGFPSRGRGVGVCIQEDLHLGGGGLHPGGSASGGWTDPIFPVNRMTDRCKNITLPQTSFAGSKTTRATSKSRSWRE